MPTTDAKSAKSLFLSWNHLQAQTKGGMVTVLAETKIITLLYAPEIFIEHNNEEVTQLRHLDVMHKHRRETSGRRQASGHVTNNEAVKNKVANVNISHERNQAAIGCQRLSNPREN